MTNSAHTLSTRRTQGLRGTITIPGDKSISHRVAILGGLAAGRMTVKNYLCSQDCLNTLRAMQQIGANITPLRETPGYGVTDFILEGCSMQPQAPAQDIDCGNSGTGMRLLAGILAALPFTSKLYGDTSLCSRPMQRIIQPLSLMGADIAALGEKPGCAPLLIRGTRLQPIHYNLPMASAQVKSAVLLAGIFAEGTTSVTQPAVTRDHTERLYTHFGIPCTVNGLTISTTGPADIRAKDITVPGDISSAAFWLVAATICPNSDITLLNVGLNETRTAVIDVLRRMGADIRITRRSAEHEGEPYGDISVRTPARLVATDILPEEIPNLIDEIPILAVAAAFAEGTTSIRNAKELRVKESDRIATTAGNLRRMGANVEEYEDGITVTGGAPLHGCTLPGYGDHRIAMSFLIAGLNAEGTTTLDTADAIDTSYPGFASHLAELSR